jgi:hypothetical protein
MHARFIGMALCLPIAIFEVVQQHEAKKRKLREGKPASSGRRARNGQTDSASQPLLTQEGSEHQAGFHQPSIPFRLRV